MTRIFTVEMTYVSEPGEKLQDVTTEVIRKSESELRKTYNLDSVVITKVQDFLSDEKDGS